ncbi:hypothetical protein TREMEDRAFT_62856 [Tremella mesenterica DSM 1558]|uniref:uncharacterized protein n=1 Tax=Tremella mesenterica (strain ATCC 24925 / CBS 8224 / DSM 1558 / NBRC 9311 / NRRL Y-6157 / RJB 2259-6 / UBC 559-6) TaxID=578456 RepID=UPI0003F4A410|nr:uncharacterized protein TREMEDRAFT_62856 [Tremella mesenterica DSM 1558]EIW69129.1 hypothetical protein TREMEDRAFT_62856 [Tremella mesenterica DSM 1558]
MTLQQNPDQEEAFFQLLSVEAMDDSILFSTSLEGLKKLVKLSERYQEAYGIRTAWDSPDKTVFFTIGTRMTLPAEITISTPQGLQHVPSTDNPKLLRTSLTRPQETFEDIIQIVDRFPLPPHSKFPLPVIRRAVSSLLIAQIRARLQFMPLTPTQSMTIDTAISNKVTQALNLRPTRTQILTLPLQMHGFDFPSVWIINANIAINTVLRALNHHLPPLSNMAQITLANWQCQSNQCIPPLESPKRYRRPTASVPLTWTTAATYLATAEMSILDTDQSSWADDRFHHVLNRLIDCGGIDRSANRIMRKTLEQAPVTTNGNFVLSDTFVWQTLVSNIKVLATQGPQAKRKQFLAAHKLLSTNTLDASILAGLRKDPKHHDNIWATDGSHKMIFGTISSTTAAMVGPTTGAFSIRGLRTSSLHGELVGLIAALTHIQSSNQSLSSRNTLQPPLILTDHKNTVNKILVMQQTEYDLWRLRGYPATEFHRWLYAKLQPVDVQVSHIKAHTNLEDTYSKLNEEADEKASEAHRNPTMIIPPPTAYMNGWETVLNERLLDNLYQQQPHHLKSRIAFRPHPSQVAVPSYFYFRSPAPLITKYQLSLKTGQFPSGWKMYLAGLRTSPECDLCGAQLQDETHIFVKCPFYEDMREQARKQLLGCRLKGQATEIWKSYVHNLFSNTSSHTTKYWYNIIPIPSPDTVTPYLIRRAYDMAISLTARIAGHMTYRATTNNATSVRPQESLETRWVAVREKKRKTRSDETGTVNEPPRQQRRLA